MVSRRINKLERKDEKRQGLNWRWLKIAQPPLCSCRDAIFRPFSRRQIIDRMSVVSGRQATGFLTNNASPELWASLKMTAAPYLEDWSDARQLTSRRTNSRMTARTRYLTFHHIYIYIFNMWQYLDHRLYWTCVLFVFSWRCVVWTWTLRRWQKSLGATIPWLVCPWGPPNHLDMEHDDIPWDCKGAIFSNHITAQDFLFCLALEFLEDSVSTVL